MEAWSEDQDADFSLAFVIESSVCCQADGRFPSSRSSTPDYKDSVFSDAVNGTYDGAEDSSASSMASSLASERDSDSDSGHDPAATVSDLLSRRFSNLEDAIASCCEAALQEGFVLHRDSSQLGDVEGESITVWERLRCKMYNIAVHKSKRSKVVDPANMRNTTPAPPRCSAMLNLRLIDKGPNWRISKLDWKHNHDSDPVVDFDDEAERKPSQPTQAEKDLIRGLVVGGMGKLNRSQALQVVRVVIPGTNLTPRQVSNLINSVKTNRRSPNSLEFWGVFVLDTDGHGFFPKPVTRSRCGHKLPRTDT
ncbi:hypothetical protein A4X03_0g8711, partial [Tilletia caries]